VAFRFRAAAALDMRRKQEDVARLEAAKAELAATAAGQRSRAAREEVAEGERRLEDAQREGAEIFRVQWHRAFIEKQRLEAQARQEELDARTAEAGKAREAVTEAMKRRRVLERLRDRALRKYRRLAHDQDVRDMNELATLRFVAHTAEGGTRAD
jgi:flagellar protein FliJ